MKVIESIKSLLGIKRGKVDIDMEDLTIDEEKLEELAEKHLEDEMKSDPDFDIPDPPGEPPEDLRPSLDL